LDKSLVVTEVLGKTGEALIDLPRRNENILVIGLFPGLIRRIGIFGYNIFVKCKGS